MNGVQSRMIVEDGRKTGINDKQGMFRADTSFVFENLLKTINSFIFLISLIHRPRSDYSAFACLY